MLVDLWPQVILGVQIQNTLESPSYHMPWGTSIACPLAKDGIFGSRYVTNSLPV